MEYNAELQFMRQCFKSCRLQTLLLDPFGPVDSRMDLGLRALLDWQQDYVLTLTAPFAVLQPNVIYHISDQFRCHYRFFLLPEREEKPLLWLGPYFAEEVTHKQILEACEKYDVPAFRVRQIEQFFGEIPVIPDNSPLFSVLSTFCDRIWDGGDNYALADISRELTGNFLPLPGKTEHPSPEELMWTMKSMEQRYDFENELLRAVSQGLSHKGQVMLRHFTHLAFEQRTPDTLRNMKNYCIIMNTLLRKAAEQGGVHPLYLDRNSAHFARRIEQITSIAGVTDMMNDMFYSYCRLVNRHSTQQYSLPIRRVITYIDSDLTADLSLKALAESQSISPGYLSTLFKKETGMTLTEYVNNRRVRHAIRLLNSTQLQIQTIARHCGIPDVNYFSKVFKKQTGKSPKEYRKTLKPES